MQNVAFISAFCLLTSAFEKLWAPQDNPQLRLAAFWCGDASRA